MSRGKLRFETSIAMILVMFNSRLAGSRYGKTRRKTLAALFKEERKRGREEDEKPRSEMYNYLFKSQTLNVHAINLLEIRNF